MAEHVIRLRGPWQYEPLARYVRGAAGNWSVAAAQLPPAGRVELPADWSGTLGPDFRGRVRFRRAFGCPTNLASDEAVRLTFARAVGGLSISLNDVALGRCRAAELPVSFDVTSMLRERNVLVVEVEQPPLGEAAPASAAADRPGGLVGEVRLEIGPRRPDGGKLPVG